MSKAKRLLWGLYNLSGGRLWCSEWLDYCNSCWLNCRDRQLNYGDVEVKPKLDYDKICAGNVGDEGWGAW